MTIHLNVTFASRFSSNNIQKQRPAVPYLARSSSPPTQAPVYRTPSPVPRSSVQLKPALAFRKETRPAPPVYRAPSPSAQLKSAPAGATFHGPVPQAVPPKPGTKARARSLVPIPAVRTYPNQPAVKTPPVVQRLVWKVSNDDSSNSSYDNLINPTGIDTTGSLRAVNPSVPGLPLAQLGTNESLHVVVHGDGKGKVEGMNASEFLDYLIAQGFDGTKHRGAIRLISCFSGTPTKGDTTFAESFASVLREHEFTNAVIGFNGLVQARSGGSIRVVAPENVPEFEMLSNVLTTLTQHQVSVAFNNAPSADATKEDRDRWQQYLAQVRGVADTRRAEVERLWQPQQIGHNIVYIPSSE